MLGLRVAVCSQAGFLQTLYGIYMKFLRSMHTYFKVCASLHDYNVATSPVSSDFCFLVTLPQYLLATDTVSLYLC